MAISTREKPIYQNLNHSRIICQKEIRMICPKCNKEQPKENIVCERCGINFAKWEQTLNMQTVVTRPSIPKSPSTTPPSANNDKTPSKINVQSIFMYLLKIMCVIVVVCGWYWYMVPIKGEPVPANAYMDQTNHFALVVPETWSHKKINSCGMINNACEVFETYRDMGENQVRPYVNVVVMDINSMFTRGSLDFTEKNKDEYAQAAVKGIASSFQGYQVEESSVIKIDGISSLLLNGSGTIAGYRIRGAFIIIPGRSKIYALSFAGPDDFFSFFKNIAGSFRLISNRPNLFSLDGGLFGSVKGDLIIGLLFALTMALIRFLIRSGP